MRRRWVVGAEWSPAQLRAELDNGADGLMSRHHTRRQARNQAELLRAVFPRAAVVVARVRRDGVLEVTNH